MFRAYDIKYLSKPKSSGQLLSVKDICDDAKLHYAADALQEHGCILHNLRNAIVFLLCLGLSTHKYIYRF